MLHGHSQSGLYSLVLDSLAKFTLTFFLIAINVHLLVISK